MFLSVILALTDVFGGFLNLDFLVNFLMGVVEHTLSSKTTWPLTDIGHAYRAGLSKIISMSSGSINTPAFSFYDFWMNLF